MRELWDAQGNLSNRVIRDEFRANSSDLDPGTAPLWSGPQRFPEAGLDADGDLIIAYEGYGPEVSENVYSKSTSDDPTGQFQQTLIDLFYLPEHSDLLQYFDPASESLPISSSYQDQNGNFFNAGSNVNVEGEIEQVLLRAINQGADSEQVGRIRALLDKVVGLLRGEANGVMFSSWDAGADYSLNRLYSDNVINAQRDGVNARYIITIDQRSTGGTFEIRIDNPLDGDGHGDDLVRSRLLAQ